MGERFIADDGTQPSDLNQVPNNLADYGNKNVRRVFSLLNHDSSG